MAEHRTDEELGKHNSTLSLARILKIFSNPVSEEQGWAICHQCAKYFLNGDSYHNDYRILVKHGIQALHIAKDGEVLVVAPEVNNSTTKDPKLPDAGEQLKNSSIIKEKDVVQTLGIIVFQALDYGLSETEEHHLSAELESLIDYMTTPEKNSEDSDLQAIDDEGIVNDDDDHGSSKPVCNFQCVQQICAKHLSNSQDAQHHYRAVCRALFAEAHELVTFLDKVSTGQKILQKQKKQYEEIERLEALERSDWARLWIQIMKQLRHGVKLKKVEHCAHSVEGEYELTPYEMLMKDIVFKRYTLNKIMVNGDIPPKVKHDAHAMILDFIRSRPPLHPMTDRVMNTLPPRSPDPHEKLLIEIRSQPKLRPIKEGKVLVETSRTKLNLDDDDESPLPVRKVIKPDFNLILDNSFEAEDDDSSGRDGTDDERKESFKRPGNRDSSDRNAKLVRRHTIMVCESPTEAKVVNLLGSDSLHTVSEVEELVNTLMGLPNNNNKEKLDNDSPTTPTNTATTTTTASTSSTPTATAAAAAAAAGGSDKANTQDLNASKLMHVSWKTTCPRSNEHQTRSSCKECRPLSCDVTYSPLYFSPEKTPKKKWQNPIECLSLTLDEVMHIRQVLTKAELESLITQPQLYDLVSRGKLCFSCKSVKFSLFSQWGNNCRFCKRAVCNKCIRKMHVPTEHFNKIPVYTLSPSPPISPQDNAEMLSIFTSTGSVPSLLSPKKTVTKSKSPKRRPLQRSQTITEKPSESKLKELKGPLMNICCDCKSMVCEVIQASRLSITLANQTKENDKPKPRSKSAKVSFKTNSTDES